MKKIKAKKKKKNVCSDWIEGVFDECNCVWGDNCQAVGFVSGKPVYAFWSDNQLTWKVANSNDTILSELKKRLQYYESEESDVYSEISTNTDSIVQLFYFKEDEK